MRRANQLLAIAISASALLAQSSCQQPAEPDPNANPLLGKPLKPFVTVDPDGNTVDLSTHLGKNVIMLDFWATWCGPCLMAMPEVEQIAKKYKDRGLVFYAMNVGEDPDTVKAFLAQTKLDIPVAMDFNGEIQNMYHAADLPHTIVIGKDGTLQVDHRGYWRGFGEELSGQVEALLDGKDLAGE